jgi:hypothetical protein
LLYTTADNGTGTTGAELFSIEVRGGKITSTDIGPMGKDCDTGTLARSSSGTLYSMCGPVFGPSDHPKMQTQNLATIDLKTGKATLFGVGVSGLAVMALGFAPDGTLYAVGDCNPDATFECNTAMSPPDPNFNTLYKVDVTSGAFTPVGPTGAPQLFMDLQFDRDGHMLGVTSTVNPSYIPAILYRLDPAPEPRPR